MADYQQIVDRIRVSIQSGEGSGMGTPAELAEAYARGCAEANERLQRCARYLQQGLRPEAIQLADLVPVLLDLVAILDFPERAEWDELTAEGAMSRAQALNLDAARAVNEAYATLAPMRDMLRRHRRLVLSVAPLSERLKLVRSIADHDQNNPIWVEDIAAYEKARLGEVAPEATAIVAREDTKALKDLLAELESPDWVLSPPPRRLCSRSARNSRGSEGCAPAAAWRSSSATSPAPSTGSTWRWAGCSATAGKGTPARRP